MNLIVLFPKLEDAKRIKNLLLRHGMGSANVCTTGAQALALADNLGSGVIICGCKYQDMMYDQLKECLPSAFDMLLVVSQHMKSEGIAADIVCVTMPLQVHELISTLEMVMAERARRRRKRRTQPTVRSQEERKIIEQAKQLLMERNYMLEEEAHRYLQKCSMESGNSMMESARMVLTLMGI